jgi:hypothetical protein
MNFNLVFLLSSYSFILLGLIALFLTEELSWPYLLMAAASFVVAAASGVSKRKGFLPETLANIMILGVFVFTLFSIFVLGTLPLQELVHFLLALQAVKLLAPKKGRDWLQLYLLSFFSLLAASALSVEISFAVIFVCYVFMAPWVLVLFHLKTAAETAGKTPDMEIRLLSWSLFRLVGAINVILFFLTLVFFITFPRLGVGFLGNSWATGSAVTGFSDRLALGEVAEIQKNNAVAMRVSIDQQGSQGGKELYWRGLSLDHFDGRKWQKSRNDLIPIRREGEMYLVQEWFSERTPLIRQRIILEPNGSQALFALGGPVAISGNIPYLLRDPLGNIQTSYPFPFQISYEALSQPEVWSEDKAPASNYLQLPNADPRVIQLSTQLTEGIEEEPQKAHLLERYLREHYRYSLKELPVGGDPLATFLFDVRQGNCEYFASALAVMLRSLGIPTRVVNGYLGGEWNAYGEYYLIRQSNAHSWVEAYFADTGWLRLDPTPPAPVRVNPSLFSSLTHLVDFLRMRWYRHVINFSFGDQYQLFTAMKQPHIWIGSGLQGLSLDGLRKFSSSHIHWWMGLALLLGSLSIGWNWLRKTKRKGGNHTRSLAYQATERYHRFLAILKKKKLIKKPGETADEFSQRAEPNRPGLVKEFTALYQRARFSERRDFAEGLKKMDRILMQLRH